MVLFKSVGITFIPEFIAGAYNVDMYLPYFEKEKQKLLQPPIDVDIKYKELI